MDPDLERGRVLREAPLVPNGNLLYFTRERQGFVCIYAPPLAPETKHPSGDLLEIYHSRRARLSIANVGVPSFEMDVARDKLVFGMSKSRVTSG